MTSKFYSLVMLLHHNKRFFWITMLMFILILNFYPHVTKGQPPSSGDWVIDVDERHENESFIINGSLIVKAKLTLINCEIILNPPNDNQYNITVKDTGALILENTTIRTTGKSFFFVVNGELVINKVSISNIHHGLDIDHGISANINHLNISPVISATIIPTYAVRIQDTSNIFINDTRITGPFEAGIDVWWSGFGSQPVNVTIANTEIRPEVSDSVFPNTVGIFIRRYIGVSISNVFINACTPISLELDQDEIASYYLEDISTPNGSVLYVTTNGSKITGGNYGEIIVHAGGVKIHSINVDYIHVMYSEDLIVNDSVIGGGGIFIYYSTNTSILNSRVNRAVNNQYSTRTQIKNCIIRGKDYGVYNYKGNNLTLEGNNISATSILPVYTIQSDNIIITRNYIENTGGGTCLKIYNPGGESNLLIYLNAFIGSGATDNLVLYYDNGTYGNYWSAYTTGIDSNGDGIYDSAYDVDADSLDRYPLTFEKWKELAGKIETVDTIGPEITIVQYEYNPTAESDIEVIVDIDDPSGVNEVILSYRIVGSSTWVNISMTYNGTYWIATIPGQKAGVQVEFKIYAQDKAGNWSVSETGTITFKSAGAFSLLGFQIEGTTILILLLIILAAIILLLSIVKYIKKK